MKKLLKKSILNGLIRTFVSIFYAVFVKLKSFNEISSNRNNKNVCHKKIKNFNNNKKLTDEDDDYNDDGYNETIKKYVNTTNQTSKKCYDYEENVKNVKNFDYYDQQDYHQIDEKLIKNQKNYFENNNNNFDFDSNDYYYEYINEAGQIFKLSPNLLKQQNSLEIKSSSAQKKYFKLRAIFVCVFVIIGYVGLNNYLIMFVYYQSSSHSSSSSSSSSNTGSSISSYKHSSENSLFLPLASFFKSRNRKLNQNLDYNSAVIDRKKSHNNQFLENSYSFNKFKIMIDPLDIDIPGFKVENFVQNNKRALLSEAYFLEDEEYEFNQEANTSERNNFLNTSAKYLSIKNVSNISKGNQKYKLQYSKRPCLLPKLNPYDSEIMQFVKQEEEIKCNPKKNWVYIENGTLRVSKSAIRKHGVIVCAYIPLYRGTNDFSVYEGNRIFPVMDRMPLITDFFKIDCRSKDGAIYSNIHSGIAYESSLHMRHIWNPMPKKALGYNVLMFGFDSVSRMSWIRMLPKSYEYMVKEGFIVLKGYNIVGDGTPQALLPILTGKKETELPEARRGYTNASYVDNFPWVWKDYKKAGYVTQWAEDMQSIGTFQLRMLGFRKQPVDHYMRLFYLEAERYYSRFRRLCLGSISRHKNMFNWIKEFFSIYDTKPKFSFIFHSEASHNYNNPLSLLDDDLRDFLEYLKHSGIMDNTILLFMSDHGVRVSNLRQYSQGKLEERLPFFSLLMPRTFQEKYPKEMRNLRLNSRKLTTPFDIHETLKHFLNFDTYETKKPKEDSSKPGKMKRGISLFKYISPNRSCEDAQIEAHWCSCLKWTEINITSNKNDNENINIKDSIEIIESKSSNKPLNITKSNSTKNELLKQNIDYNEYKRIRLNLINYSKHALLVANKAVEFMNSLIDKDLKFYCEKIRLHSIQKLSKLDLNKKLLTFKKSKDIHGREALFEEDPDSNDTFDENFFKKINDSKTTQVESSNITNTNNATNMIVNNINLHNNHSSLYTEHVFQIVLTTWPGNATYELSLKYDRYNGLFKFNKNEISRINNYNGTSNCMLKKRPDLRQYCYCRYL